MLSIYLFVRYIRSTWKEQWRPYRSDRQLNEQYTLHRVPFQKKTTSRLSGIFKKYCDLNLNGGGGLSDRPEGVLSLAGENLNRDSISRKVFFRVKFLQLQFRHVTNFVFSRNTKVSDFAKL